MDEKDAAISQLQNELLATKTQLQTVEAESKKMSSMSGDKDGLNAMLQTKIKELAEASAKAATVETLQKELDEKTKEGISLHANVKALEAKTQDEGRELQELRAKLQKIHGEQVTKPLVRPTGSSMRAGRCAGCNRGSCCKDCRSGEGRRTHDRRGGTTLS